MKQDQINNENMKTLILTNETNNKWIINNPFIFNIQLMNSNISVNNFCVPVSVKMTLETPWDDW